MSGKVAEVTDSNFEEFTQASAFAVVNFGAAWCGPCRLMTPIMDRMAEQFPEVNFGDLNVDYNHASAAKFDIMNIPAIVAFRNGEEVDRHIGACTEAEMRKKIEAWRK